MVDRRHFLKCAAASTVAAAAATLPRASHAAGTPRKQPNLVVIVADDLRWDSIGALGNRIAQTPAIDRLARHGRLFPNTFVTTSICPTSRASIFTGQYARRHGIWSFDKPLNAAQMQQTYPAVLRAHGYQTGFVGKWGLGGELPASDFDLFHGISGQGYYYDPANGGRHLGDLFREQALQTLSAFKPDAPFCLVVCSKEVHEQDEDIANPYQPMDKFRHLYENITFPRPATANRRSFEKLPPFLQTSLGRVRWEPRFSTDELFQKTMKEYYQVLSGLDDICGGIIDMLVQKGVMDETIIVFTSDNGNMLGDHDLAAKWFMFEESIRVPLIIHAPQIFGSGVVDPSTALNIDIAPTLLALANVPIPETMQGRSLYPAPEAAPDPAPRDFLYEHLLDIPGLAKSEGVRSERFKYIKYYDGDGIYESLFDLLNDPFEETDLARTDRGAEMLPALRQTLARLIAAAG